MSAPVQEISVDDASTVHARLHAELDELDSELVQLQSAINALRNTMSPRDDPRHLFAEAVRLTHRVEAAASDRATRLAALGTRTGNASVSSMAAAMHIHRSTLTNRLQAMPSTTA